MKTRLKEARDLPKDTQYILAKPEPESQFPASREPLSTASWGEERKKADVKSLESRNMYLCHSP